MASEQELQEYVEKLPTIYREILAAFPRIEPSRKAGYGLAFQTLGTDFQSRGIGFGTGEIINACDQLRLHGIVEINHHLFVHPTEYGERLIGAITGVTAPTAEVPVLPTPPR